MAQEIERKFLVVGPYKDFATSHYTIRQGYICSGGAGRYACGFAVREAF